MPFSLSSISLKCTKLYNKIIVTIQCLFYNINIWLLASKVYTQKDRNEIELCGDNVYVYLTGIKLNYIYAN